LQFFQRLAELANQPPREYHATYRAFPVACTNRTEAAMQAVEQGDKIVLPPSALDNLAAMKVTYPMMFELTNPRTSQKTHCGVMEFSSEEGVAYLPYWMMANLGLESGHFIELKNVTLPKGSFVQFQPHKTKFTELANPRVVLEKALRNFSCLTQGDTISIRHGGENFLLDITEVRPPPAVSIYETDVNVDFKEPRDYAEHKLKYDAAKKAKDQSGGKTSVSKGKDASSSSSSTATSSATSSQSAKNPNSAAATSNNKEARAIPPVDIVNDSWDTPAPSDGGSSGSNGASGDYFARLSGGYSLSKKKTRGGTASPAIASTKAPSTPPTHSLNSSSTHPQSPPALTSLTPAASSAVSNSSSSVSSPSLWRSTSLGTSSSLSSSMSSSSSSSSSSSWAARRASTTSSTHSSKTNVSQKSSLFSKMGGHSLVASPAASSLASNGLPAQKGGGISSSIGDGGGGGISVSKQAGSEDTMSSKQSSSKMDVINGITSSAAANASVSGTAAVLPPTSKTEAASRLMKRVPANKKFKAFQGAGHSLKQ